MQKEEITVTKVITETNEVTGDKFVMKINDGIITLIEVHGHIYKWQVASDNIIRFDYPFPCNSFGHFQSNQ